MTCRKSSWTPWALGIGLGILLGASGAAAGSDVGAEEFARYLEAQGGEAIDRTWRSTREKLAQQKQVPLSEEYQEAYLRDLARRLQKTKPSPAELRATLAARPDLARRVDRLAWTWWARFSGDTMALDAGGRRAVETRSR